MSAPVSSEAGKNLQKCSCEMRAVYLVSSAPVSCSSSLRRDEGKYRWSSEIFWVPCCVWQACLTLSQGTVGVSGRRKVTVTSMLQMSFTVCQKCRHYDLGDGVSNCICSLPKNQQAVTQPAAKTHKTNHAETTQIEKCSRLRLFVGVTTSEHSCFCPKLEEEFIR